MNSILRVALMSRQGAVHRKNPAHARNAAAIIQAEYCAVGQSRIKGDSGVKPLDQNREFAIDLRRARVDCGSVPANKGKPASCKSLCWQSFSGLRISMRRETRFQRMALHTAVSISDIGCPIFALSGPAPRRRTTGGNDDMPCFLACSIKLHGHWSMKLCTGSRHLVDICFASCIREDSFMCLRVPH